MITLNIKFDRLQPSTVKMNDFWGTINGKTIHIMLSADCGMVIHPDHVAYVLGIPDPCLVTDQDMTLVYSACERAISIIKTFSIN